eukprot:2332296-Pyramimonas_sp.AAC.1
MSLNVKPFGPQWTDMGPVKKVLMQPAPRNLLTFKVRASIRKTFVKQGGLTYPEELRRSLWLVYP